MKKWVLVIGLAMLCLFLAVAGGGYLWLRMILQRSLPQILGEVSASGLKEQVEVIRDSFGLPHIYARNEADLYFALGFAMAQDRFWQMELHRRLGRGRLAEIFGQEYVRTDLHFRAITSGGMNDDISSEIAFIPRSFAAGVNAYLKLYSDRLPIEFTLLGYKPESWAVDDHLAILKVLNWSLSMGWEVDLTAADILRSAGEEKLRDAFPVWPGDGPLIVHPEAKAFSSPREAVQEGLVPVIPHHGTLVVPFASNNWVVSGKKSTTGSPLLANDTHLPLTNPSFWWEVHLVCPTMNVSGFAVPGLPGVAVGHNEHVAWGVTNVMVDDVDFFIERINPEKPRQYWYRDHWEEMSVVEEAIGVKGQDPVRTEVLLTRHGPIIDDEKEGKDQLISAKWALREAAQPLMAAYLLAKAQNIHDVIEALRHWEAPCQNFVFADTQGGIGYWCCAAIPLRRKGDGLLPVPGWTGEYEWHGYVPFEDRPHLVNPPEGFIATANNRVSHDRYPHPIGHYWEPMDRVTRIRQLLQTGERLSPKDFQRMQQDVFCVLAPEITPTLIRVLQERFSHETARNVREVLVSWDFRMDADSAGACLFEVAYRKLMDNVFEDELGEELFLRYLKTTFFPPRALRAIFRKGSSPWFDDVKTPQNEGLDDVVAKSLSQAISELQGVLGNKVEEWKWGRTHTLTFEHALGRKRPLDLLFNLGPFPVSGNNLTIDKKQYALEKPFHTKHGASQRMITDLSGKTLSLHVLPTGESGHLKSPHHADQVELYLGGRYHPAWTDRADVERYSEGRLLLKPHSS